MNLKTWRISEKFTLQQAADFIGVPLSTYYKAEREAVASRETEFQIDAATGGKVGSMDITLAWRALNFSAYADARSKGRAAAAAFRKAASHKPKENDVSHGKKNKRKAPGRGGRRKNP